MKQSEPTYSKWVPCLFLSSIMAAGLYLESIPPSATASSPPRQEVVSSTPTPQEIATLHAKLQAHSYAGLRWGPSIRTIADAQQAKASLEQQQKEAQGRLQEETAQFGFHSVLLKGSPFGEMAVGGARAQGESEILQLRKITSCIRLLEEFLHRDR